MNIVNRRVATLLSAVLLLTVPFGMAAQGDKPQGVNAKLRVYFVDVEGGQSTLFVTPTGQSLLIDIGWPGNNGRDANRIMTVAKQAGQERSTTFC